MYPNEELTVADHKRAGKLHPQADRESTGDDAGVDDVDAMIAAVAQRYDEPVLTESIDDFLALGGRTKRF